MKRKEHNLLIFHHHFLQEKQLHFILSFIESDEQFCIAHELVDRNRITSNPKKILKETRAGELRVFRFLINKN